MRYDDMIETVLRAEPVGESQLATLWSQLSDLLVQKGHEISPRYISAALIRLSEIKHRVAVTHRVAASRAIASGCSFVPLVTFYAGDVAPVAQAMLSKAQVSEDEWLTLIPLTTPLARGILRKRCDLGVEVERALQAFRTFDARFGTDIDETLNKVPEPPSQAGADVASTPVPSIVPAAAVSKTMQISDVLHRIKANPPCRDGRTGEAAISLPAGAHPGLAQLPVRAAEEGRSANDGVRALNDGPDIMFNFETNADGIIGWTSARRRGAIIGITIAEPALDGEAGVDNYSADAFGQRSEINNATLRLEADVGLGGDWRFSAVPLCDVSSGKLIGYKGTAHRQRPGEATNSIPLGKVLGSASFGDSMRQLVHELRTPLNSIYGFAQMIDGQIYGTVPQCYRTMADEIISDSSRLMTIFGDLELAAQMDSNSFVVEKGNVAMEGVIETLASELDRVSDERQVWLRIELPDNLPMLDVDPTQSGRLIHRFLRTMIEVGTPGETIEGHITPGAAKVCFFVTRPRLLRGQPVQTLLDPRYSPGGDAPEGTMLSLGFSLRLVFNLARALGGRLDISAETLTLQLPAIR